MPREETVVILLDDDRTFAGSGRVIRLYAKPDDTEGIEERIQEDNFDTLAVIDGDGIQWPEVD